MDTKNAALENVSRFKCAYFEYLFVKFPWRSQIMGEKNVSKKIFPTMAVEFIAAKKKNKDFWKITSLGKSKMLWEVHNTHHQSWHLFPVENISKKLGFFFMLFPWVFLHGEQHEHGEEFHTWATKKKRKLLYTFHYTGCLIKESVFHHGLMA